MAAASSEKRMLLTGATGLQGRQVLRVFKEHNWSVRGLGNSRAKGDIIKLDIFDMAGLAKQLEEFKPTVVIHCAAERRPDRLEGKMEEAEKINGYLVRDVGRLCKEHGAWMIHISTNYVFDGKAAPYAEDAATNPVNTYGKSKRLGETELLKAYPNAAVVRVPLLFGQIENVDETSVTQLLPAIQKPSPKLDDWQERFPTSTDDVADVLEAFSSKYLSAKDRDASKFGGIFHWQSNEMLTKYTMALAIADIAGLPTGEFIRNSAAPPAGSAPRPQFERMSCARLEKVLGIDGNSQHYRSDFKSALGKCLGPHVKRQSFFARLFKSCGWCQ